REINSLTTLPADPTSRHLVLLGVPYDPKRPGYGAGSVTLHDTATGKPSGTYRFDDSVRAAGFDPEGSCLAATEKWSEPKRGEAIGDVYVWRLHGGQKQAVCGPMRQPGGVQFASFSPGGRFLLTAGRDQTAGRDRTVFRWDLAEGRPAG